MKSFIGTLALGFAVIGGTTTANAQLIYDNLHSNDPFSTAVARAVGLEPQHAIATRFTAQQSLLLDSVALTLWGDLNLDDPPEGEVSAVFVSLHAHTMGGVPGGLLESVRVELTQRLEAMPLTHAQFSNSTLLSAGTEYWLAVSPVDSGTSTAWEYHGYPPGYIADRSLEHDWSAWVYGNEEGGMRVFGTPQDFTPIPEPGVYGMFAALCIAGAVALRRRQQRGN
jgi:hypothetical protein